MEPDKPRHLNDETAMMPAIPRAPRHSADDPDRRGTPYLDSDPAIVTPPRVTARRHARRAWWRFWSNA